MSGNERGCNEEIIRHELFLGGRDRADWGTDGMEDQALEAIEARFCELFTEFNNERRAA